MHITARAALFIVCGAITFISKESLAQITKVDIFTPSLISNPEAMYLTGNVEATRHANVAVMEPGSVAELYVDAGSEVKAGDKLLKLDSTLADLLLAQDKASLQAAKVAQQEAERLLDEVLALSKQQSVAKTLIEERRANLANARAELVRQQAAVSLQTEIVNRHTLYAPFSGVISNRKVDIGEWVTPQSASFILISQSDLRLVIDIPQEYYTQVAGKHVVSEIIADSMNASSKSLVVSRVIGAVDPLSRTFKAHIDLPSSFVQDAHKIIPGMSASAKVYLTSDDAKVWLPKKAIKQHPDGGTSVFSVTNGVAKRHFVKIIESTSERVSVSGLNGNEQIVISGVALLKEGTALKVNEISTGNKL